MPEIKINDKTYDLNLTWLGHQKLKDELGEDYTDKLLSCFDDRDFKTLSIGLAAATQGLTSDEIYYASPPIDTAFKALKAVVYISFYGPNKEVFEVENKAGKKLLDRVISLFVRQSFQSKAG